jgi:hypothetical protein
MARGKRSRSNIWIEMLSHLEEFLELRGLVGAVNEAVEHFEAENT